MSSYYFSIIGTRDNPIYELEFSSFKNNIGAVAPGCPNFPSNIEEILPFITNASLDIIEDSQWTTNQFYLGKIDSFYGLNINAFITQGSVKLILCYDASVNSGNGQLNKSDETAIRQFFSEVYEYYVKCLLNPFYCVDDAIVSPEFDIKIKMLARKYL